jgi:predicted hydrolase (HD superfamily)
MPVFTIVTTTATRDVETVEVSTLADEFANESEAIGYSRRMAEEMVRFAEQLSLDFDYSSVGVYEGELLDEELTPDHPGCRGLWALDDDGPAFVTPEELGENGAEAEV